tara:strand:+ start:341 stop:544 length:204 start_codon:yes stop_codon:yes gene_type:complete
MNITNFVRDEEGKCTFSFEVDNDEAGILMEFAIRTMIEAGLIDVPGDDNPTDMFEFFADDDNKETLQ